MKATVSLSEQELKEVLLEALAYEMEVDNVKIEFKVQPKEDYYGHNIGYTVSANFIVG